MKRSRHAGVIRLTALVAIVSALLSSNCAGQLASRPSVYSVREERITAGTLTTTLVLVTPSSPPPRPFLVLFASGDGGLTGVSMAVLQHLGDQGYYVAGFSSREALRPVKSSGGLITREVALESMTSLIAQAKRGLNLPDNTPVVMTGMSRGATLVIAAAGAPTLRPGIVGGVAMALTAETDYFDTSDEEKSPTGVQLDDKGRVLTYPAIERLGTTPLAIIQSTNDSYVPSRESRRLLGPDTPTRRLYEVESRNHSFGGGRDALMRDLDDAMRWIAASR